MAKAIKKPNHKPEEVKPKEYSLSEAEIKNVQFRRMLFDYVINALNQQMGVYVYTEIRPRLGLPDNVEIELSEDGRKLYVVEAQPPQPQIVGPEGVKAA